MHLALSRGIQIKHHHHILGSFVCFWNGGYGVLLNAFAGNFAFLLMHYDVGNKVRRRNGVGLAILVSIEKWSARTVLTFSIDTISTLSLVNYSARHRMYIFIESPTQHFARETRLGENGLFSGPPEEGE